MTNIILSQFVEDTIKNLGFSKEEILEAAQNPDQNNDFDGLSITIKYYKNYLYLLTKISDENNVEVISAYKTKESFLADFVNPLVMRSIIDRITNDIKDLSPYELIRLFLEIFSTPLVISDVGLRTFYIDSKKKIIAQGILEINKYKEWILSS